MIIDNIKKVHLDARKSRNTFVREIFTTFLGDTETHHKNGVVLDDPYVIRLLKKYIENAKSNYELTGDTKYADEAKQYEQFMPKQLTEEELRDIISSLKREGKDNMKDIMGYLKENHAGLYDGKLASKIAKEPI